MRWNRPSVGGYDELRRKIMRETEAALLIGLRFPHMFHRIPTVEVGAAEFSREFASEYWESVLGLGYPE